MKHWAIIDRKTGEHQFVATEDDQHPTKCGHRRSGNRFVELEREPEEHDRFEGDRLVRCEATRARIDQEAMLNRMSRLEFFEHLMDEVERRQAPRP
jgi:hypothetical protein